MPTPGKPPSIWEWPQKNGFIPARPITNFEDLLNFNSFNVPANPATGAEEMPTGFIADVVKGPEVSSTTPDESKPAECGAYEFFSEMLSLYIYYNGEKRCETGERVDFGNRFLANAYSIIDKKIPDGDISPGVLMRDLNRFFSELVAGLVSGETAALNQLLSINERTKLDRGSEIEWEANGAIKGVLSRWLWDDPAVAEPFQKAKRYLTDSGRGRNAIPFVAMANFITDNIDAIKQKVSLLDVGVHSRRTPDESKPAVEAEAEAEAEGLRVNEGTAAIYPERTDYIDLHLYEMVAATKTLQKSAGTVGAERFITNYLKYVKAQSEFIKKNNAFRLPRGLTNIPDNMPELPDREPPNAVVEFIKDAREMIDALEQGLDGPG